MAGKTTKSTKKTKTAKNSPKSLAEMWKSRCYGTATILLVIILGLLIGGIGYYMSIRDRIMSDEDMAALETYDEVAESFVNGFDLRQGAKVYADVQGYGISPDGDFYISYKLNTLDDLNNITDSQNGKIYFWESDDGHRSFGFGYEE